MVVPNITAIQERREAYGVPILTHVGENAPVDIENYYRVKDQGMTLQRALNQLFRGFVLVEDPDGHLIEFQQR